MHNTRINRLTPVKVYRTKVHAQIVTVRVFTAAGLKANRKSTRRQPVR